MSQVLEAWLEGRHVGIFVFDSPAPAKFVYDDDAPGVPISLSLPRNGTSSKLAPQNFLDNLLPDAEHTRIRMARSYGAADTTTFELLGKAGRDLAGGLVLLPEGTEPSEGSAAMHPVLDRDLADRISSIKRDADAWVPPNTPARFSLAGTQGKFAMAKIAGEWYWSNEQVASTHIVKPGNPRLEHVEEAETAALSLARRVGINVARAEILRIEDQQAFMVERFDRVSQPDSILPKRLHAEDLAQAMGIGSEDKYKATIEQAYRKLSEVDADGSIGWEFLTQVIFNTLIGNADAHAKNYSLLMRPDRVSLAPMYDVVPVILYPEYEQNLAMRIAGARTSQAVSLAHWRKLAKRLDVEQDEMTALVHKLAASVGNFNEDAWQTLDPRQTAALKTAVERNVGKAISET